LLRTLKRRLDDILRPTPAAAPVPGISTTATVHKSNSPAAAIGGRTVHRPEDVVFTRRGFEFTGLAAYLHARENLPAEIERFFRIMAMPQVILEIGCGTGETARCIAERNPGIGVIATDQYDLSPRHKQTSHYFQVAEAWKARRLTAQLSRPDNLALLRSEIDILLPMPERSIDTLLLVHPEPSVGKAVLGFLKDNRLEDRFRSGERQIVVKPFSRNLGLMACGLQEFDQDADCSRGLGFLFECPYGFVQSERCQWGIDLSRTSPYSRNSTQTEVFACAGLAPSAAGLTTPPSVETQATPAAGPLRQTR
jgi:SAM-dependent methyltransferase